MTASARDYAGLIAKARSAFQNSYAPVSKFRVGAALLADDGTIVTGCNIEGTTCGGSICAERTALVKAVSEGKRSFTAVAVVAEKAPDCWPCGNCRQHLFEFSPEMEVVVETTGGALVVENLSNILPQLVD